MMLLVGCLAGGLTGWAWDHRESVGRVLLPVVCYALGGPELSEAIDRARDA